MPDSFLDFKKQRSRWAFGAMQILRRHFSLLFRGTGDSLSPGQRYHFVAGWLPWLADGVNVLFTCAALGWSLAMICFPKHVQPPLVIFSLLPMSLFLFKIVKLLHLYRTRVGATFTQTVAAAVAGLGLSHTIGMAMLSGLVRRDRPFFRTPKCSQRHALGEAFAAAREEALLMGGLWLSAFAVSRIPSLDGDLPGLMGGPDLTVWVAVLMIQSLPYAATVLASLVNALELPGRWIGEAGATEPAAPATGARPADVQRLLPLRLLLRGRDQRLLRRAGRADEETLVEDRP